MVPSSKQVSRRDFPPTITFILLTSLKYRIIVLRGTENIKYATYSVMQGHQRTVAAEDMGVRQFSAIKRSVRDLKINTRTKDPVLG
jgi:hypothetical protein